MCHPELIHPKHASLKDDILHVSGALKKSRENNYFGTFSLLTAPPTIDSEKSNSEKSG